MQRHLRASNFPEAPERFVMKVLFAAAGNEGLRMELDGLRGARMDWIERLFHLSPDGGSGSLEVGIIAGAAVALAMVIAGAVKLGAVVKRWSSRVTPDSSENPPAPVTRSGR